MDSNSKFIYFRKLWTVNRTKSHRCGNLNKANKFINGDTYYSNLKYILINVGVNDTDENNGVAVFNKMNIFIDTIERKYPTVKIILSEITPRKDVRDAEVIICNHLLHQLAKINKSIYVAKHRNLRDEEGSFLQDEKHTKKNGIARCGKSKKGA